VLGLPDVHSEQADKPAPAKGFPTSRTWAGGNLCCPYGNAPQSLLHAGYEALVEIIALMRKI